MAALGANGHNGDPVNTATGNKYEVKTEYRGAGPFPLDFTWTYNSTFAADSQQSQQTILGIRRAHTYQRNIHVFPDALDPDPALITASVSRPDGNTYAFAKSGSDWISPSALDGVLTASYDTGGNVTAWSYLNPQNEVESFDAGGNLLSITDPDGHVQTMSYDTKGRLATVTDMAGRQLVFSYNDNDRLSQLALPDGGLIQFAYNAADGVQTVTYPGGKFVTYLYGETAYSSGDPGLLTGEQDETGTRYSTTTYDSNGLATGTFLGTGVDQFTVSYTGFPITQASVTTPLGETRTYSSFQNILGLKVPNDFTRSCSGCTPHTQSYSYSTDGHLASVTDLAGNTSNITQDSSTGLETQRVEAVGTSVQRTIQTDWNFTYRKPSERRTLNAAGTLVAKTNWTYNGRGQQLTRTQTDPATSATRTTTTTYCEASDVIAGTCPTVGLVTLVNGPRTDVSDVTTYTYYASDDSGCPTTCPHRKGDLWKVTNALGKVTTFTAYDGAGRLLSSTDPNGVVTDRSYNARGWTTQIAVRGTNNSVTADDQITGYTYYDNGLVHVVTQPDASTTTYTYDAAHRLTDIADNIGDTIHYTLNAAGNRTKEDTKDPASALKRSVVRTFNVLGQVATTKNADGTTVNGTYTYDANGNPDLYTNGRSIVTDNDYDALNRLSQVAQDPGTSPPHVGATTHYTYDPLDELTQVTDPHGLNTTYQFDGLGNQTQLTSRDTGTTTYAYDAAGNRTGKTDARGTATTSTYDALNRLTGISYPTSTLNMSYGYDTVESNCPAADNFPIGHLTHYTDESGTAQLCYDRFGHMVFKNIVLASGGSTYTIKYAYDKAGRITQVTEPKGTVVSYTRDGIGRITQVTYHLSGGSETTVVSNVTYYPFGPVATITYGNGRTLTRTYDQDYAIGSVIDTTSGKTDGLSLTFGRDVMGNLTQVNSSPTVGNLLQYDALDRLTNVNDLSSNPVWTYTYDATGNRLSEQAGTATAVSYTYPPGPTPPASHRLVAVGSTARTYNAMGSTASIGGTALGFSYDDAGRMSQTKVGGTVIKSYQYDALGQRVRKSHTGFTAETVKTMYDESGHVLGDFDSGNQIIDEYVWMDDLPVAVLSGSTGALSYIEPDHLGTPRVAIDGTSNAATWSWPLVSPPGSTTDSAFGATQPTGSLALNLRFPGQVYDAESGMNYNYFRDYDADTGRYIESDPIGLGGGISTYGYAGSNPMLWSDPAGLDVGGSPQWCIEHPEAAIECEEILNPPPQIIPPIAPPFGQNDSNCPNDKCPPIVAAIKRYMQEINNRAEAMRTDRCGLFQGAYDKPNPNQQGIGCKGSWLSHANAITEWQNGLKYWIDQALKNNCPIPFGAFAAAYLKPPAMPRGY